MASTTARHRSPRGAGLPAAGVVAGLEQWESRLERHADDLEGDAARAERDDEQEWRAEQLHRDAAIARGLAEFITTLARALQPGRQASSWSGLANWCRSLVRTYLGGESLRGDWPPEEQAAAQRIDAAIDRLGDLDGIDPNPSTAAFRRALQLQLGDDLGRRGTFGNGVLVGTAAAALGLELDQVIVVGMAEGSFPARRRDDPLLPDRYRAVVGPDLPQRSELVHDDHRALLATMAAANHVTLTFPGATCAATPSERRHAGCSTPPRPATECGPPPSASPPAPVTGSLRSHRSLPAPTHRLPHIRAGVRHPVAPRPHRSGSPVRRIGCAAARPEVRTGAELLTARLSSDYTRFDGNLATDGDLRGVVLPDPTGPDQVVSATRLEKWAVCPHAYFVRYVLGVSPVEDPEEQYRISPTLGSLVHDTLDTWITEALHSGTIPEPGTAWPEHRSVICANSPSRRRAGCSSADCRRRVYWGRDHQVLLRDLEDFVDFDTTQRAAFSSRPIATELPFGMPGSPTPPVEIPLADGRTLSVRGASIVSTRPRRQRDRHRLQNRLGPLLQGHLRARPHPRRHPSAARAVQPCRPPDPAPTRCAEPGLYWFVTAKGGFSTVGYPVRPEIEAATLDTVGRIVDGIAAGHFPAHPAAPGYRTWVDCPYCEPDALGLSHQYADWQRLARHPELADYVDLCGGDRG